MVQQLRVFIALEGTRDEFPALKSGRSQWPGTPALLWLSWACAHLKCVFFITQPLTISQISFFYSFFIGLICKIWNQDEFSMSAITNTEKENFICSEFWLPLWKLRKKNILKGAVSQTWSDSEIVTKNRKFWKALSKPIHALWSLGIHHLLRCQVQTRHS